MRTVARAIMPFSFSLASTFFLACASEPTPADMPAPDASFAGDLAALDASLGDAATDLGTPADATTPGVDAAMPPGPVNLPRPSGMPWASGAWTEHFAGEADSFATMRGRPVDTYQVGLSFDSWANYVGNWWTKPTIIGPCTSKASVSIDWALHPTNIGTIAQINAGNFDTYYQKAALNAKSVADCGRTLIIRLGWEFNIATGRNNDDANDPAAWKQAYQRIEGIIKAAIPASDPQPLFELCFASGSPMYTNAQLDTYYPGDSYVDIIATDNYDGWNPATDATTWTQQQNRKGGLNYALNLAMTHRKKVAVAEWGLADNSSTSQWSPGGGGDNPYFIQQMFAWFQQHQSILAYESYFNHDGSQNVDSLLDTSVSPPAYTTPVASPNYKNPKSTAMYQSLYR